MAAVVESGGELMQTMIVGAITGRPAHPVALKFQAAYGEFIDGYTSYFDRRGPGQGRLRCAGWLQAHREEMKELEARHEERRSQF